MGCLKQPLGIRQLESFSDEKGLMQAQSRRGAIFPPKVSDWMAGASGLVMSRGNHSLKDQGLNTPGW